MIVQLGCESHLLLLELCGFGIVWIFSPRHPHFANFKLAELHRIETRDVILMSMRRDHNRELLVSDRPDVIDDFVHCADVSFAMDAAVHEDVSKASIAGKRQRDEKAVAKTYSIHANANGVGV